MDKNQDLDDLICAFGEDKLSRGDKLEINELLNATNFFQKKTHAEIADNYDKLCLPEYQMILNGVTVTKEMIVNGMREDKGETINTRKSRPHRYIRSGDTVVVFGETSWTYILDGIASDFQDVPFCDIFKRMNGKWYLLFTQQYPAIPVSQTPPDSKPQ